MDRERSQRDDPAINYNLIIVNGNWQAKKIYKKEIIYYMIRCDIRYLSFIVTN